MGGNESPVSFYVALVGAGVATGGINGNYEGLLSSFERTYGQYVCGLRGRSGRLETNGGYGRSNWIRSGEGLGGFVCVSEDGSHSTNACDDSIGDSRWKCFTSGRGDNIFCGRRGIRSRSVGSDDCERRRFVERDFDAGRSIKDAGAICADGIKGARWGSSGLEQGRFGVPLGRDVSTSNGKSWIDELSSNVNENESSGKIHGSGDVSRDAGSPDGVGEEKEKKNPNRNVPGAFGNSRHEGSSGSEIGHGPNWERNKKNRSDQKARKIRRKERQGKWNEIGKMRGVVDVGVEDTSPFSLSSLVHDQNVELRNSLAAKWKAENALAKLRAERQFAVLSASDLQDEVKQHRTKLNATIERNMVSIEKTHATLRATGNVAGEFHGSAETVMTPGLSSGTISPDSSASMQEFRAVQKRNLDLENKIKIATEKLGVDIEHIDLYDKEIWTNNSVNEAILDKMYPDGYGMDGTFYDEGKVRVIPT